MTDQEMQALIAEGTAIDAGQAAHDAAAAEGRIDDKGGIIAPVDETTAKAAEWFMIPKALAWAITSVFPETTPCFSDEKCMELAKAIVPVADKYGLNGPGDSPELALVVGTAFFCMPAVAAYKQRKARAEADAAVEAAGGKVTPAKNEPILNPINGTAV